MEDQQSSEQPDQSRRTGNLASTVAWPARWARYLIAFGLGILSSVIFAPLEWTHLAWVTIIPLIILIEKYRRGHFFIGFAWGLGHFLFCLAWLKEVILPAPLGVALIVAVFPAVWAKAAGVFLWNLRWSASQALTPKAGTPAHVPARLGPLKQVIGVVGLAALWCALEWCRSWVATGFPWNLVGVSMWNTRPLLPLVAYTGVFGLSFVILSLNIGLYLAGYQWLKRDKGLSANVPYGLLTAVVILGAALVAPPYDIPPPETSLKVTCVQGNIPQIRVPTEQEFELAQRVYWEQTLMAGTSSNPPDLIVWPETALPYLLFVPTTKRDGPAGNYLREILSKTEVPMLIGSLDTTRLRHDSDGKDFNSAILIDSQGRRVQTYDKIKTVPFGEFLPFESYYPGPLKRMLKQHDLLMRSLSRGTAYTVFEFQTARIGVNICYEDIFPEVSRQFVLRGANVLMTITNDAWYNETSGSHQHLVHAVFRAVETARPILRSGNNSDTCLILPDGSITESLVDPHTGSRFYRGRKQYNLPIYPDLPTTFYTRYGNCFAHIMTAIALACIGYCVYRYLLKRKAILNRCSDSGD